MARISDLPTFHEAAEALAAESRMNSGGSDVEGVAAFGINSVVPEILLKIDVGFEGAATDFSAMEEEPPGLVIQPHVGGEPVAGELVEGFAVKEDKAAKFGWEANRAKFDHRQAKPCGRI